MSTMFRNTLILVLPFFFIIVVNERVRVQHSAGDANALTADKLNSNKALKSKCSWRCHYNTEFCKSHHVKMLSGYFQFTDPLYLGLINILQIGGKYELLNVLGLGLLWPLVMYFLLIRSLDLRQELKAYQSNQSTQ